MPACFTVNEIGRVDPSVNDSSTPSARLQIALQKRPLIDCQSGYDFAGGNLNSKAVTTGGAMCSRVIVRVSERVVAIPGWFSSTLLALARKLRRRSPKGGRHSLRMIALLKAVGQAVCCDSYRPHARSMTLPV